MKCFKFTVIIIGLKKRTEIRRYRPLKIIRQFETILSVNKTTGTPAWLLVRSGGYC